MLYIFTDNDYRLEGRTTVAKCVQEIRGASHVLEFPEPVKQLRVRPFEARRPVWSRLFSFRPKDAVWRRILELNKQIPPFGRIANYQIRDEVSIYLVFVGYTIRTLDFRDVSAN